MIKFDDRFSADHDGRQWVLTETYMGKAGKKDGVPKEQTRDSYYGNLRQVCAQVLDMSVAEYFSGTQASLDDVIQYLMEKEWQLEGHIRGFE